jgi:hypothetical protein
MNETMNPNAFVALVARTDESIRDVFVSAVVGEDVDAVGLAGLVASGEFPTPPSHVCQVAALEVVARSFLSYVGGVIGDRPGSALDDRAALGYSVDLLVHTGGDQMLSVFANEAPELVQMAVVSRKFVGGLDRMAAIVDRSSPDWEKASTEVHRVFVEMKALYNGIVQQRRAA